MADGKQIKISAVLDTDSFNRVTKAFRDLGAELQKFAKQAQMSGGLMSGANVGRPPTAAGAQARAGVGVGPGMIGKAVIDNANAFKSLAGLGVQSLKGLTDALKTSVRDQAKEVRDLQGTLGALERSYQKLGKINPLTGLAKSGQSPQGMQAQMVEVAGKLASAKSRLSEFRSLEEGFGPEEAGKPGRKGNWFYSSTPNGGGAGGGGPGGSLIQGFAPGGAAGILKIGALIGAGISAVVSESMGGTRTMARQEERRGSMVNGRIRAMMGGDITDLQAMREMTGDYRKDMMDQTGLGAGIEARIQGGAKGIWNTLTGNFSGGSGGGLHEGQTTAAVESHKAEQAFAQLEAKKNSTDFLMRRMGIENFQQNLGSRTSAGRILGVGVSRDPVTGQYKDSFNRTQGNLQSQGYDIGDYAGAVSQARALGGNQFARANAGRIMGANAAGYGGYAEVLGAAARSGGNAQAAMGGGIATHAGIQLGQSMFGFDPRGTVSGNGAMLAAQTGFGFSGTAQDFNQVARIQLGMAAGDKLASGFDGYQQGQNILGAIGAMPNATTYAQDSLGGKTSFKELLELANGGTSARSEAYGYGSKEAKKQLGAMAGGVFGRFRDQGGSDPASAALRAMSASGMSETDYLAKLGETAKGKGPGAESARKSLNSLGVWAADEMGESTESGIGMVGMLSGVKNLGKGRLATGKDPAGGIGDIEKAANEAIGNATKRLGGVIETYAESMKEDFAKLPEATNLMVKFGTDLSAEAKIFIQNLDNLAKAIDIAAFRISKGQVGSSGETTTTPPFGKREVVGNRF
jgi:hypothetical protein